MTSIRSLISALYGTFLSLSLLASSAQAQDIKERQLKLAFLPTDQHPIGLGARRFTELVTDKSGGKIKIRSFSGGSLGGNLPVISALQGGTNVAFLAIEAARADRVIFSAPYVSIEGTYLLRHGDPYNATSELDHEGSRIAVAAHAAYDLFLTRTLRRAELVRAPTPATALDLIADEGVSGAAGVRQALESFARGRADLRVLPDAFMTIEQALATPLHREAGGAYLQPFIADLTSSGWLRAALDRNGQSGVRIATPRLDMANATPIL